MGVRGEIFSSRVILPNRTYFFNVKENRMGDIYLNIVESKNRDNGGFDRQSVILFADDLHEFLKGFDESLRVLEKSVREKRRSGREESPRRGEKPDRGERAERTERSGRGERDRYSHSGEKSGRGERNRQNPHWEKNAKNREHKPRENRRLVVKKTGKRPASNREGE